ncbi:P-loop containing nucleoside triphosphate hydrolase protein [Tuber brumale]|nr:P-loop containing nucleoside triphosphate hydrolase protein [Tuber brumale]
MGLGLATIFAGFVGNVVYMQYSNLVREKRLHSALAMGAVPDVESTEELVERPGATRAIEYILKPQRNYAYYDMIVGNHGTGKTTMVRHVAHQLDGILYVDISPKGVSEKTFAEGFAKAFHWTPATSLVDMLSYWGISAREAADDRAILDKVFKEFHHQAKVFKKNKGRPPVLVLDNVNRLAQDNRKLLNILQDIAKDAADNRLFTTVFVTSEGQAPIQMLGRSASSRLGKVVEIGDLNNDEAIEFLCNKRDITEPAARDIYGLVGGRVGLLARAANELNSGLEIPGVRALLLADVNKMLQKAGMKEGGESRRAGLQIATHILQNGRISCEDFYQISGSNKQGDELLSKNIFTTIPRSEWVFFDTKPMEIAVRALVDNSGHPITTVTLPETRKLKR